MTAAVTASYLPRKAGLAILEETQQKEINKTYKQTYDFAREVLNRMPAESEEKVSELARKSGVISDTKDLTTVRIATVIEKMKYDTPSITVQAGKKVKLYFPIRTPCHTTYSWSIRGKRMRWPWQLST